MAVTRGAPHLRPWLCNMQGRGRCCCPLWSTDGYTVQERCSGHTLRICGWPEYGATVTAIWRGLPQKTPKTIVL